MRYLVVIFLLNASLYAQKIDHTSIYRTIEGNSYLRFHYDNDYFAATDENYTQGYNFEVVSPVFKHNPINSLLLARKFDNVKFGLALEHIGFTPNRYELPDIQYGDRPFSAAIMLKSFSIGTDFNAKTRWHSSLSLGMIGPAAFGADMQEGIHRATGNKIPLGWSNQIRNDVVVNYELGIEKQLFRYSDLLSIQTNAKLQLGTLFSKVTLGSSAMIGLCQPLFDAPRVRSNLKFYAFVSPGLGFVGYDATLQGGLFNRNSPYTIHAQDVERMTFQADYGLVLQTRTLYFEYVRSSITKEFRQGNPARWGGIRFGFTF